jgi:hypothetical protein
MEASRYVTSGKIRPRVATRTESAKSKSHYFAPMICVFAPLPTPPRIFFCLRTYFGAMLMDDLTPMQLLKG